MKLAEAPVLARIADSPFFEVLRVSLPEVPQQAEDIRIEPVKPMTRNGGIESGIDQGDLKQKLFGLVRDNKLSSGRFLPLDMGGSEKPYFVPMAHTPKHPVRGFIVVPTTPKAPLSAAILWAAVGTSITGAILVAASITRMRRSREYAGRLAILNNLPMGVIEANSEEEIVLANDRAEEIVCRPLPKAHSPGRRVNFKSELIEEVVVQIGKDGENGDVKRYEEAVQDLRRSDESSSYYACLRNTDGARWIRVSAVPILSNGLDLGGRAGNGRLPMTFGVIDRLPPEKEKELWHLVFGRRVRTEDHDARAE